MNYAEYISKQDFSRYSLNTLLSIYWEVERIYWKYIDQMAFYKNNPGSFDQHIYDAVEDKAIISYKILKSIDKELDNKISNNLPDGYWKQLIELC